MTALIIALPLAATCDMLCGCEHRINTLMMLYNSTNGAGWTVNTGWRDASESVSHCALYNWTGVYCNNQDIYAIDLRHNNLVGSFPNSLLGSLPALRVLYLSGNPQLQGTLSDIWTVNSSAMQNISLDNTSMTGTLPPQWSAWKSLWLISLANLQLTGTLPGSWSALTNLTWALLTNNSFTGTLPASWSTMQQLQIFDVSTNKITGTLPSPWSNMTKLLEVYLYDNSLTGSLPDAWSSMTQLTILSIASNRLTGTVPSSWNAFTRLKKAVS